MYKTILVGDTNTDVDLFRILKDRKREDNYPTVGIEVGTKSFEFKRNNTSVNIQFWDTAGQQRFRSVCLQHYKGAKAALLLYDITNRQSFNNLGIWLNCKQPTYAEIKQNVENENIEICLIGNKLDKRPTRVISRQQAEQFAKKNNLAFYEQVSAETGQNINIALQKLLQTIISQQPSFPKAGSAQRSSFKPAQTGCGC